MWDIIFSLIYRQFCRKSRAGARMQRELSNLWAS
jgi:hypothetical protein